MLIATIPKIDILGIVVQEDVLLYLMSMQRENLYIIFIYYVLYFGGIIYGKQRCG